MSGNVGYIQQKSFEAQQFQSNVVSKVNEVNSKIILDGLLIKDVSLGTTENKISHKLGRSYNGYIVTKINAGAVVYVSSVEDSSKMINLKATASCVADLWVF